MPMWSIYEKAPNTVLGILIKKFKTKLYQFSVGTNWKLIIYKKAPNIVLGIRRKKIFYQTFPIQCWEKLEIKLLPTIIGKTLQKVVLHRTTPNIVLGVFTKKNL